MRDQAERLRQLVKGKEPNDYQGNQWQNNSKTTYKKSKVITVSSGKGGVGKSTSVVNLSLALHELNYQVLLVDGNLGLFNLDILLGMRSNTALEKLMAREIKWQDAVSQVYPGMDLICGSKSRYDNSIYQQENENELKSKLSFIDDIKESSQYDYIIIDTGAGVNETVFAFAKLSDLCAVVTTPELTSVTDTYALIKSLIYMKVESEFKLIINRCLKKSEGLSTWKNISRVLTHYVDFDIDILGYIYEDPYITKSIKNQQPAMKFKSDTSAGLAIRKMAKELENVFITEARS